MYTKFVSEVLFPLHERLKGHSTVEVHRQFDQSQWLAPKEMADLQIVRLRDFLRKIGNQVPYYRDLFLEHDFDPSQLTAIADLEVLPTLTKSDIRANTAQMKKIGAKALQRFNTGGSSGEPLVFFLGKERVSHDVAAKRRATRWWGVDIGDREIVVWGSPIELGTQDRLRLLRDELFRTELLSAFEMSTKNLDRFVDLIRAEAPRMLFGYPSSLAHIASHARARGLAMDGLDIRVAFVTSERLYPHQREQIESTFGCPVANGYGGRDAGFIAHECPAGSMHITAEDIVVEILGPEGNVLGAGESGEIVVTHMATSDFPFLRYRTGDIGQLQAEPCSCGRGLPVLAQIEGRTTDFLVAQNGTIMHGLALIYVVRDMNSIDEFKIVQESRDRVVVQVVPNSQWSEEEAKSVVLGVRERLGQGVQVDVEAVASIPAEKSGKRRYIISHVSI